MSLYTQLQQARGEEDVKDAYIKALGLKGYPPYEVFAIHRIDLRPTHAADNAALIRPTTNC